MEPHGCPEKRIPLSYTIQIVKFYNSYNGSHCPQPHPHPTQNAHIQTNTLSLDLCSVTSYRSSIVTCLNKTARLTAKPTQHLCSLGPLWYTTWVYMTYGLGPAHRLAGIFLLQHMETWGKLKPWANNKDSKYTCL
jgi:hypothetical protein